MHFFFLNLF